MDLQEIRKIIRGIDVQIIDLLTKRISLVPNLVSYKKGHNMSIFQPEWEKQMYMYYWNLAVEKKINPELVRKIFDLIIFEMTKLQRESIKNE